MHDSTGESPRDSRLVSVYVDSSRHRFSFGTGFFFRQVESLELWLSYDYLSDFDRQEFRRYIEALAPYASNTEHHQVALMA